MRLTLPKIQDRIAELSLTKRFVLDLSDNKVMVISKTIVVEHINHEAKNRYVQLHARVTEKGKDQLVSSATDALVYCGEMRGLMALIAEYRSYTAPSRRKPLSNEDFVDFIHISYDNLIDFVGRVHIKDLYQTFNSMRRIDLADFKVRLLKLHRENALTYQLDRGSSIDPDNARYGIPSENGLYVYLKYDKETKP